MTPSPIPSRLAVLRYNSADFDVVKSGDHVLCAVTGRPIPLEALNYWSVELQEPYGSAAQMTQRWLETR